MSQVQVSGALIPLPIPNEDDSNQPCLKKRKQSHGNVPKNDQPLDTEPTELTFTQALAWVLRSGESLAHVGPLHQRNYYLVFMALNADGCALQFACEELRKLETLVLQAIAQDALALQFAGENCRGNSEIVVVAVKKNGLALEFASEQLRAEWSVVKAAVQQNGLAIQFATKELRADMEMVQLAAQQNPMAWLFAVVGNAATTTGKRERVCLH
jgi:hypothetical protein